MRTSSSAVDLVSRAESRKRRRLRLMLMGFITVAGGLYLLAIPPDTMYDKVIWRVIVGFVLLLGGSFMAIVPVIMDALGLGTE
jgi:hypothetical protein